MEKNDYDIEIEARALAAKMAEISLPPGTLMQLARLFKCPIRDVSTRLDNISENIAPLKGANKLAHLLSRIER